MSMEIISREDRPWGFFEVLHEGAGLKIKRIVVRDMQRLSLQTHEQRDEYWFVTSGRGIVTINETEMEVYAGATYQILRGEKHRVQALGADLEFYEVQTGGYLGEDDIVRHADDYGR